MQETARILEHATPRSLAIIDELGRGCAAVGAGGECRHPALTRARRSTAYQDGLAIAWATAESLAQRDTLALFATHFHHITVLHSLHAEVHVAHMQRARGGDADDGSADGSLVSTFKLREGSARPDDAYGIDMAQRVGMPRALVELARGIRRRMLSLNAAGAPVDGACATALACARRGRAHVAPLLRQRRSSAHGTSWPLRAS